MKKNTKSLTNKCKIKSVIGIFLRLYFELSFLPPKMVNDVFSYEINFYKTIILYPTEQTSLHVYGLNVYLVYNEQRIHEKHFIPS